MQHNFVTVDADLLDLIPNFIENRKRDALKMKNAALANDLKTVKFINSDVRGVALPYGFTRLDEMSRDLAHLEAASAIVSICDKMVAHLETVNFG